MNQINPKKLLNSKWTVKKPAQKEKHFIVTKVVFNEEDGLVEQCQIEAVFTKRTFDINWYELKEESQWVMGWL